MTAIDELKVQLVEQIAQADWRAQKAEEYPDDDRSRRSAASLRKLQERLSAFPATEAKWSRLWNAYYGPRRSSDPDRQDESLEFIGIEREALRRYGFYKEEDGDPAEFLDRYIGEIEAARARNARQ
jgi:hypothetical protein